MSFVSYLVPWPQDSDILEVDSLGQSFNRCQAEDDDDSPEQTGLDHTPCSTVETPPLRSLRDQLHLRLQTRTRSLIASISGLNFDGVKEIREERILHQFVLEVQKMGFELHSFFLTLSQPRKIQGTIGPY